MCSSAWQGQVSGGTEPQRWTLRSTREGQRSTAPPAAIWADEQRGLQRCQRAAWTTAAARAASVFRHPVLERDLPLDNRRCLNACRSSSRGGLGRGNVRGAHVSGGWTHRQVEGRLRRVDVLRGGAG